MSKFELNPFISLQVTVSKSNQLPNFLQKWEKVNFVLIKHYFLRGKTLSETKAKLD